MLEFILSLLIHFFVSKIPTNSSALQLMWLLIPLAIACSGPQVFDPLTDNTLVIAIDSAPINLDPRIGSDQSSSRVFNLILNGLVTKDLLPLRRHRTDSRGITGALRGARVSPDRQKLRKPKNFRAARLLHER